MSLKAFSENDVQTAQSFLTQLVDVIQEDVSGSTTRRKYQVFVTGGVGPGVTSSLFQTVYDQDFTLQTSNPMLDMTVGLFFTGSTVYTSQTGQVASSGKLLFPSQSMMMREKIDVYKEFAKTLLGDADKAFYAPFANRSAADSSNNGLSFNSTGFTAKTAQDLGNSGDKSRIDEALFLTFKRLFHRDGVRKETLAFKMFKTGVATNYLRDQNRGRTNLNVTTTSGSTIFSDANASDEFLSTETGGVVGNVVDSVTGQKSGLVFYDRGVVVLDVRKIISGTQHVSGVIKAMNATSPGDSTLPVGTMVIGDEKSGYKPAAFVPDLMVSASIDDIVDHFASCRFSSGSLTAMTFQNVTNINSTLYFCRATADEFNYSSNSTYLDSRGNINVIDASARQDGTQKSFSFVTKVGLHDAEGNLLAVAKLSRPVEKNAEKDITFRVRLDF